MSKFGQAFRAARDSGKKTFMWNGNSYNTKYKEEVSGSKPKPAEKAADKPALKPTAKTEDKPAPKTAEKTPASKPRVGIQNTAPALSRARDAITGAVSSVGNAINKGVAAADAPYKAQAKAKAKADQGAAQQAEVDKAKKDYNPNSAGSNFKVAMSKMGFKKGGSIDGCAQRGKTKGRVI